MPSPRALAPARCLLVWLAATFLCGGLGRLWASWLPRPQLLHDASFEQLLAHLCTAVLLLATLWAWLAVTALVWQASRGGPTDRVRGVPVGLRRLVLVACGAALAGGLLAPAGASPDTERPVSSVRLDGLPMPDRATGGPAPHSEAPTRTEPPAAPTRSAVSVRTLTVQAGDTLWSIATDDLPPGADDAAVNRHWRLIHDLNRQQIGADPDLILPGQRLRMPH